MGITSVILIKGSFVFAVTILSYRLDPSKGNAEGMRTAEQTSRQQGIGPRAWQA